MKYFLVDVFTQVPFGGNPLAVFPEGREVPPERMQPIARELNLSETTFVLPAEDGTSDFRVRIFTPAEELPFAGHPTLGTAFVLARLGRIPLEAGKGSARLQEGVGSIPVKVTLDEGSGFAWMEQPKPRFGPRLEDRARTAELLSIDPGRVRSDLPIETVSCGLPFLLVPITDLATMRTLRPRQDLWSADLLGGGTPNVLAFTLEVENAGSTVHARMFSPWLGVVEDPATGSAAGPLGSYLVRHEVPVGHEGDEHRIRIEQGIEMGRPSFLEVAITGNTNDIRGVRVGGGCVPMGSGELELASPVGASSQSGGRGR